MSDVILRVAAKGVIFHKDKILVLKEANTYKDGTQTGKFGLPGGRIEANESFSEALNREILEEAGIEVEQMGPIHVGEWWPNINGQKNHIVAIFVVCKAKGTDIKLSNEHDHFEWIDEKSMPTINLMPPDDLVIKKAFSNLR